MLSFAVPLGLLALGALLVPILIHLVRQPPQVVRLGNLRWLEATHRPVRALRWQELLLLALRMIILSALALAVAGLAWRSNEAKPIRWLLRVPGASLDAAAQADWERWRREGFEARDLAPGFPAVSSEPVRGKQSVDAWSLLRELEFRSAPGSRAVVFGPTRASQFRGPRPSFQRLAVTWREVAGGEDSAGLVPPRVGLVLAPDRAEDARYLRAALEAIGVAPTTSDVPQWIFQLGDVALPPEWTRSVETGGARLVTDAPAASPAVSVMRTFEAAGREVRLRQRVPLTTGAVRERDGAGEAWLTEEKRGAGTQWRFALRFHPEWSDWPLGSSFPAWWRAALFGGADGEISIGPEAAAPRFEPNRSAALGPVARPETEDLTRWCWLLAAIAFGVERYVSWQTARSRRAAP